MRIYFLFILSLLFFGCETGQTIEVDLNEKIIIPKHYVLSKTSDPILIDGIDNEKVWNQAKYSDDFIDTNKQGHNKRIRKYKEYFFNNEIEVLDIMDNGIVDNTPLFSVPEDHFFVMGDNRDNSQDSRFIDVIGYVPIENLVGKAQFIFFSLENSRFLEIWKWPKAIRFDRLMKHIK